MGKIRSKPESDAVFTFSARLNQEQAWALDALRVRLRLPSRNAALQQAVEEFLKRHKAPRP